MTNRKKQDLKKRINIIRSILKSGTSMMKKERQKESLISAKSTTLIKEVLLLKAQN